MARIGIDRNGVKHYINSKGQWHRSDGPALIYSSGLKSWYHKGKWLGDLSPSGVMEVKIDETFNFRYPNGHNRVTTVYGKTLWPQLQ